MLTWHYVSSTEYNTADASTKTSDKLYFLSDTKQIYRGTELFTEAVSVVSTWPTTPAVGRLYVDETTLEGRIYNGSAWVTVIQPVQASIDSADTRKPVSGKAVADYVSSAISDVTAGANRSLSGATYSKDTQTITFTRTDGTDPLEVEIEDLPVDLVYNSDTGLLQLKDADGAAIGTGINLDLERFVKSGSYDAETGKITLVFNDDATVEIDASALVDVYEGAETSTATVSVSADNKISATVKVSAESDNTVVAKDDGLYVAPTDLSDYIKASAVEEIRAALQDSIDANATAISAEETRAKAAEEKLTTDLGTEITRAKAAEEANAAAAAAAKTAADNAQTAANKVADDLATETARAKAAEGANATAAAAAQAAADKVAEDLAAETTRAKAAEEANATAAAAAKTAAAAAKTAADNAKTAADNAKTAADNAAAAAAAEKTRAEAAEGALQGDIDALELALEWKTTV